MKYTEFSQIPSLKDIESRYPTIRLILWDMDGTLFHSEPLHALAIKNILPAQKLNFDEKEIEAKFKGIDDKTVYYKLKELGIHIPFKDFNEFIDAKNQYLVNLVEQKTKHVYDKILNPSLSKFILEIPDTIKMCVVTASEKVVADSYIHNAPWAKRIEKVFSRFDTHLTKPSASPYMNAMREFKSKGKEVLIFEDSPTGLEAASETGAHVIKASWY